MNTENWVIRSIYSCRLNAAHAGHTSIEPYASFCHKKLGRLKLQVRNMTNKGAADNNMGHVVVRFVSLESPA